MKRRRPHARLTERQQLILALLLVIFVAISMLYCLGFASLALRQAWRDATLPWNGAYPAEGTLDLTKPLPAASTPPPSPLP